MATVPYLDHDREVAADEPLDLVAYLTADEARPAPAEPDDWLRDMRPVDVAFAVFLCGVVLAWLAALAVIAYHAATVGL